MGLGAQKGGRTPRPFSFSPVERAPRRFAAARFPLLHLGEGNFAAAFAFTPELYPRGWRGNQREMTHIVAGNKAPGFSLKSLDNKEYSLNTLLERGPVVAAFFKISCPVCQFTFPFLERLYKQYGDDRATFLGVSQDDARATKDFAREYAVTFPLVLDENSYPVSNAYGLTNVPTILLIDTDGTVKVSSMGFDKKDLETIAAELAQRKKISLPPLFRHDEVVPANQPG